MISISPFKALRPEPQFARQVASRPYDVLNTKEAKVEAEGNPLSFLHITKSEIDLPVGTDVHSKEVYLKAKENLDAFISKPILFSESKPCYYIYSLQMNGRTQTGLVACSSVEDYENGKIKKHEFTRPEKEKDRIDHIVATGAQTGNVFIAFKDIEELNELMLKWQNDKSPVYNFTAADGIQHTVWVINDEKVIDRITELFRMDVESTYIADGHHRIASAARVKYMLPDNEEAGHFLSTLFPASQLAIMDYNRVVRDLNGLDEDNLLQRINKNFTIEKENSSYKPDKPHNFGMYLKGQWYKLTALDGTFATDPVNILDTAILQKNLLEPVLGIHDQRTDKRIDFVGGIRGIEELELLVDTGAMAVAFSIFPVTIEQLFAVADSGEVMPPKSTWFEPKLRDGLLTHLIV
ncbi:MAG: DUF1015 domain-containing protein [Bacteroidetes bacterium]|nr:DUF1015 domain-containing protein [Bacteroidota bacterium]